MHKNILLLYISEISGHHQASLAIEEALRKINPNVRVRNINSFSYINPAIERFVNKTYMGIIKRTPEVWEFLYDNPRVLRGTQKLRKLIHQFNSKKLKALLDDFNPDIVACTQAFPCSMIADYKDVFKVKLPLVGILTDFAPHSYWLHDEVDSYIVPSSDVELKLIEKGVKRHKIKPLGIPIRPAFLEHGAKREQDIYKELGLGRSTPTVLIMGGGQGLGPIKKLVFSLDKCKNNLQIIVIAGTNKKLYTQLKKRAHKLKKRVAILEFVDNVNELMEISTLIVTKPGGITTAEALAKNLPIVILKALPGQEAMNAEFLLKEGIAVKPKTTKEAVRTIEKLLSDHKQLTSMREASRRNARPNASFEAAHLLLGLAK